MFSQHDRLLVMTQDETIRARVLQCFAPSLHDKVWHVDSREFWKIPHVRKTVYVGRNYGIRWLAFVNNPSNASSYVQLNALTLYDHAVATSGTPTYVIRVRQSHPSTSTMTSGDLYDVITRKVYTWVDGEGYRVK